MRNELLEKAILIREWPVGEPEKYESVLAELGGLIDRSESREDLVDLIHHEIQYLCLPFDLYTRIYERVKRISELDDFVSRWYAGMTKLYGDPTDEEIREQMSRFFGET